ncbi:MAG: hypothetical protein AAF430_04210 [Myxococcota bacterium]
MTEAVFSFSPWSTIQDGGPGGAGNRILRWHEDGSTALLKLYFRRTPWPKEMLKRATCGPVEARLGVTAEERCQIERDHLSLWHDAGFCVPKLLTLPLPSGTETRTANWMEYLDGPLLSGWIANPDLSVPEKTALLARLAGEWGARHQRGVDSEDVRFFIEHAGLKHVVLSDERLVSIDLETRFHPKLCPWSALARETSSVLRSIWRHAPGDFDVLARSFVDHHPRPELLLRAARRGLEERGLVARIRRSTHRRQSDGGSKTEMLGWLHDAVEHRAP